MIRVATVNDLDAIMALERRSFPEDAWSVAVMRAELAAAHSYYVIDIADDGALVGYAGLRLSGRTADIQTIAVAEELRGRGRGRALMTALLREASRRAVAEVFLEVRSDNPVAQALYSSLGFEQIDRRTGYYPGADAVVMRAERIEVPG